MESVWQSTHELGLIIVLGFVKHPAYIIQLIADIIVIKHTSIFGLNNGVVTFVVADEVIGHV